MSGEFRDINARFMWEALEQADEDGCSPVSQALGELYRALAPMEKAAALREAGDISGGEMSLRFFEHARSVERAAEGLAKLVRAERQAVENVVRTVWARADPPT